MPLNSKWEKESKADFISFNSSLACIIDYDIERRFQEAYTNAKFKEFQEELRRKIYCQAVLLAEEGSLGTYEVVENVKINDTRRDVTYHVYINEVDGQFKCLCRLFEFRDILFRQVLTMLIKKRVKNPSKYIPSLWKKDLKRMHLLVKNHLDDSRASPQSQRLERQPRLRQSGR